MMKSRSDYGRMASAIEFLVEHGAEQPQLAALTAHFGLSATHLHRLFKRWVGITPKDFLQALTLTRAKRLLSSNRPVLDASLTLGFSSASRLYDLFVSLEGMTPGEYKRKGEGQTVSWDVGETPFGQVLVAATSRGVSTLHFVTGEEEAGRLAAQWPGARLRRNRVALAPVVEEIRARMSGRHPRPLPLFAVGSAFQLKVWEAMLRIPEGQVVSYSELAATLHLPRAVRAVASAVAANGIGYIIPCHRVIRSSGVIGDYRWGCTRKAALIASEVARLSPASP